MTNQISPHEWEMISAYLDGQLAPNERSRLEARLRGSEELRDAMDGMRQTRALLRSQPRLRAPRNFTLRPDMVEVRRKPGVHRAYPTLRFVAALASLVLVLVLVGDLFTHAPPIITSQNVPLTSAEEARQASAPSEAGGEPADVPMISMEAQPTLEPGQQELALEQAMPAEETEAPAGLSEALQLPNAAPAYPAAPGEEPSGKAAAGSPEIFGTPEPGELADSALASTPTPAQEAIQAFEAPPEPTLSAEGVPTQEPTATQVERFRIDPAVLRTAEILLAILAVSTGLLALYLRRTGG